MGSFRRALSATPLLFLTPLASPAPIAILGTLSDPSGFPLEGTISVISESGAFRVEHHEVSGSGTFQFDADSAGGLVVLARVPGHPAAERLVPDGETGTVTLEFQLPAGQAITGRVVNGDREAIAGAAVQLRYIEPDLPPRRVQLYPDEKTDADGRFSLLGVGIDVPFYIDVHAPGYLAKTTSELTLAAGQTDVGEIALDDPVGAIVVRVVTKDGAPIAGAAVAMIADKSGIPDGSVDSRLHQKSYGQTAVTTSQGSARFFGVPPGTVTLRVNAADRTASEEMRAKAGEEVMVTLELL